MAMQSSSKCVNSSKGKGLDICYSAAYMSQTCDQQVLALDLEGVHDLKLHHPSSSVATSNQ